MTDRKLVDPRDAYNFRRGHTYVWSGGRVRRLEGLFGVWWRVKRLAVSLTRWWRPRTVCAAIDHDAGVVTMAEERWSWRRWRWERT